MPRGPLPRTDTHRSSRKESFMTKASLAWLLAACAFAAHAADPAAKTDKPAEKAPTAQQSKMKSCNTQAEGKKGDDRKAFMKECLSAKGADVTPTAATAQQSKMKDCNAQAADKKGDERKAFMKECLSKKG
jgi:hypothetical protein